MVRFIIFNCNVVISAEQMIRRIGIANIRLAIGDDLFQKIVFPKIMNFLPIAGMDDHFLWIGIGKSNPSKNFASLSVRLFNFLDLVLSVIVIDQPIAARQLFMREKLEGRLGQVICDFFKTRLFTDRFFPDL
jgi:hypothetical protein